MTPEQKRAFWMLHEELPRQAPGSDHSSKLLLELAALRGNGLKALDIGCGPGRSALVLAMNGFDVTAIDTHEPFLRQLREAAEKHGLAGKIHAENISMFHMPFPEGSFDLMWSEGAAYIIGWEEAVKNWPRLVKPNGKLVLTECCWLTDMPSDEAKEFWAENYPHMLTVAEAGEVAKIHGLVVEAVYTLPDSDWWIEYYAPLEARLMNSQNSNDNTHREVMTSAKREIDLRKNHASEYGYVGYVLSKRPR